MHAYVCTPAGTFICRHTCTCMDIDAHTREHTRVRVRHKAPSRLPYEYTFTFAHTRSRASQGTVSAPIWRTQAGSAKSTAGWPISPRRMQMYLRVHTHPGLHHPGECKCIYVYTHISVCTHVYVYTRTSAHLRAHVHLQVHLRVHMYISSCVHACKEPRVHHHVS